MEKQFGLYAEFYDVINCNKNYYKEAKYIHQIIQKYHPNAKSILSLGCGTGKYECELKKYGYEVVGVDISENMVEVANSYSENSNCKFVHGDIRTIRLDYKFDIIISLFHVICYQTSNNDLLRAFKTVSDHLDVNGVLIFDYWYGPAVLRKLPEKRLKHEENDRFKVTRKTTPNLNHKENIVDVYFEFDIVSKIEKMSKKNFSELHRMRYLFLPELKNLLLQSDLSIIKTYEWLTCEELSINSWNALTICKAIKNGN